MTTFLSRTGVPTVLVRLPPLSFLFPPLLPPLQLFYSPPTESDLARVSLLFPLTLNFEELGLGWKTTYWHHQLDISDPIQ
jgi:hypothetical protein